LTENSTFFSYGRSRENFPNRTWKGEHAKDPSSCSTTITSMAPLRVAGFIEFHVFETDPLMLLTYCMAVGMRAERPRGFESRPTREGSKRGRNGRDLLYLYSREDGAELDEMVERALVRVMGQLMSGGLLSLGLYAGWNAEAQGS
jgi:hypothetical protein